MTGSTVSDVMSRDVISVRRAATYKDIVRILLEHDISAIPVVDEFGHAEGLVSEDDMIEKEAHQAGKYLDDWELLTRRGRSAKAKAGGRTARELMSAPVIAVVPGASLAQAARLMRRYEIKHLPVVDAKGVLVGIVSRGDLLTPYLRPDADLQDEIVRDVLAGQMCISPLTVDAEVLDGVVTLRGRLESDAVAREAVRLVRALDGVVEVIDELTTAADNPGLVTAPHFHAPMSPLP